MEELKKSPEKFVEGKIIELQMNEDHLSDTGSWGTDFEDEVNEESSLPVTGKQRQNSPERRNSHEISEANTDFQQQILRTEEVSPQEEDGTYANCGPIKCEENTYANCQELKTVPLKNTSRLHGQGENSLAEQLKEQLKFRNTKKPMAGPKPESLQIRNMENTGLDRTTPRKSFLHNASKTKSNGPSQAHS